MKITVSRPSQGRSLAVASTRAVTGEQLALVSGLFCLFAVALLLSACQQPSSSASSGSSVQQSQSGDLDTNRERHCCRRASRGGGR